VVFLFLFSPGVLGVLTTTTEKQESFSLSTGVGFLLWERGVTIVLIGLKIGDIAISS
jgi:hypothetical protein